MKDQSVLKWLVMGVSLIALLGVGVLGVVPLVPPAPPAGLGEDDFTVVRALEHIERIAQEPRPIGSPANRRVRADIVAQLETLGLAPEVQTLEAADYFGGPTPRVEIGNVVARIPGTAPTMAVALVGHFDSVPSTLGANDNASAVAIMLEVARAILAGQPLRNDIIFVFTDGEEPAPRFGSSAFVARHPWAGDIGFVINLEAIGSGGQSTLTGMSGPAAWLIDRLIEAAPYPAAFSFLTTTVDLVGGSKSDFDLFKEEGIAGVEFAYLRGSPVYHTMADTLERVSQHSLYQQGANTLALTRHLGKLDLGLSRHGSKTVFFSVGRFNLVEYPTTWALPVALVTGAVLAAAGWRQRTWLRIFRSAALTVAMVLGSAVVAVIVWTVLAGQRGTMGVVESYLYLVGLLVLTAGIGFAVARLAGRQTGDDPDATGVVIVWWALGLLTAIAAPGMSYLFVWPALAGGVTLLWRTSSVANRWCQPILAVPVVGTALVLFIPAIDIFYQLAQPRPGNLDSQILPFIAVPVLLLALVVELFRVFWVSPTQVE